MSLSNRRFLVFAFGLIVSACSANGVGTHEDGGGGNQDGSTGNHDGSTTGGDGSQTGGDGSQTGGDGSHVGDGSTTGGDGSTTGGDGSTTGGDGSTTGGDGGTTGGDGGTGCGATEVCGNGMDDDCDGVVDEGCACQPGQTQQCYDGPPAQAGRGVCTYGTQTCEGSGEFGNWGSCVGAGHPQDVVCGGGMDYRCDGIIDEGCACTPGATRSCYTGPAGTEGVGLCSSGSQTCVAMNGGADWGPCMGDVVPQPELCDGADRDCDGNANSGCVCVVGTSRVCYDGPAGTEGVGLCHAGAQSCVPGADGTGAMWGPCMDEVVPGTENCDGQDHLCNGMPGAGCACTIGQSRACYTGTSGRNVGACHDGTQNCVSTGSGAQWSATCSGEVTPAAAETCMNRIDDNCNGQTDEGCGGTITCPGSTTVNAGSPVTLSAAGMGITNITWTIVSAPTGGASTVVWSPSPPTSLTETFTPTIVGDYVIRISGTDSAGNPVSCMFTVSALPHGLRVEMTWDGTGDVDLHLHNSSNTAWFGGGNDCYYGQTSTTWGANLDFDNTSANGPENIRVDTPALNQAYTIAAHNYARAAGRIVTIKIFCGSTTGTTPTQTFTSRALNGSSSGNCSTNDFWKVARVVFTSATACTITPINTYTASNNACSSF